jgi:hypothetical protein
MTEDEQMEALGPVMNEALQKLLPKNMKCAVVLYNSEHRLMTLGNAHPRDIRTLLKAALEVVDTQLSIPETGPINDNAIPNPK